MVVTGQQLPRWWELKVKPNVKTSILTINGGTTLTTFCSSINRKWVYQRWWIFYLLFFGGFLRFKDCSWRKLFCSLTYKGYASFLAQVDSVYCPERKISVSSNGSAVLLNYCKLDLKNISILEFELKTSEFCWPYWMSWSGLWKKTFSQRLHGVKTKNQQVLKCYGKNYLKIMRDYWKCVNKEIPVFSESTELFEGSMNILFS